jgi:hypothetical protein
VSQWLAIRAVGGAVNDIAASATATRTSTSPTSARGRTTTCGTGTGCGSTPAASTSNLETDDRPQRLHDAYPDQTLTRLRRVEAAYDPDNVFNQNFPIS